MAETPGVSREAILDLVLNDYEHSRQYHEPWHRSLKGLYDLYRCIYNGKGLPGQNKVMLPLLLAAVWSDIAFKVQTAMGGVYPFIEFRSDDPLDTLPLKRSEAIVNQQFLDARMFQKMIDLLGSAEIYGTGILRLGWRVEKHLHKYRHQLMPGLTIDVADEMTLFDGPDAEVVDLLDFFPHAGKKDIERMGHGTHRTYIDLDDLAAQELGGEPLFDPAGIKELYENPMQGASTSEYTERSNVWRSISEYEVMRTRKFGKPVEILERWGLVPSEFAPDGYRLRVITIANRRIVLRNDCNPFWSKRLAIPFRKYCPMPDLHFFQGVGKAEIVSKTAALSNKLVSLKADALEKFLGPAFIASEMAGIDGSQMILWPGRVIKTRAPDVSDTHIRPISPDLRGLQMVYDELGMLSRYIQQATGVAEDTIQGMVQGARTTAREFLARSEMGKNRLSLEVLLFEKNILEPVAEDFRDMDRQWLDFPRVVRRLGASAVIDPDTGYPVPPEPELMTVNDMNIDSKAHAVGSSQLLGKNMQIQNLTMGGQFAMANPMMAMQTNWNAFASRYWKALDLDPNEMIANKIPQANMIAAMLMGQGGGGGVEGGMGSSGGNGMEQLDATRIGGQGASNVMPMA